MSDKISIVWIRRDLRLDDNTALVHALNRGNRVLMLFIFDEDILKNLPKDDARVTFIHDTLNSMDRSLNEKGSSLLCIYGTPMSAWEKITAEYEVVDVFANKDYEPYAMERDNMIRTFLDEKGIPFHTFKDQVIFEENEVQKDDGKPYTVYTPYKNKWLKKFNRNTILIKQKAHFKNLYPCSFTMPTLHDIGFVRSGVKVPQFNLERVIDYPHTREFPIEITTLVGPHLRFGTISIRKLIAQLKIEDAVYLNELIWREFFMQILYHFPRVINNNFKQQYDFIKWRNNEREFDRWCNGTTGYPLVDAGMRQLNNTGFMHNRVRMVVASFLCKHLLIDWRWGEAYFAAKLLDYDLSANNGNWQWAAGTGCDAAPYFRVFNPSEQLKKFDKDLKYVRKWIPEFDDGNYPEPMVDHQFARKRALDAYKKGLQEGSGYNS